MGLRTLVLAASLLTTIQLQTQVQVQAKGLTKNVTKVVVFGDSYSDTGYNALLWPNFLGTYLGIPVHSFAKAGATCSNVLTPRVWPDVTKDELSTFNTQRTGGSLGTLDADSTVYTLWIGTNDVGAGCMATGDQVRGVTVVDTTACAVSWVKTLYDAGARNFLFQNMVPLHRSPVYQRDAYLTRYWTLPINSTQLSLQIEQTVYAGNTIARLLLANLAPTLPDAHIGMFDSYGLFFDIIQNPENYLNGTAPFNVTGAANACPYAPYGTSPLYCTTATGSDADSFVWDDELHPSVQTNRVVAREIASVLRGTATKWVNWFS